MILDILRALFTKDNIDTAITYISKLRELKTNKKLVLVKTSIPRHEFEKAGLLITEISQLLSAFHYSPERINSFSIVANELIANGVTHGTIEGEKVHVSVMVNAAYTSITVRNGRKTAIPDKVMITMNNPQAYLAKTTGRGLMMIYDEADIVTVINNRSIKAVLYKEDVEYDFNTCDLNGVVQLHWITVTKGLDSRRLCRKLKNELCNQRDGKYCFFVVDIRGWEISLDTDSKVSEDVNIALDNNGKVSKEEIYRIMTSGPKRTPISRGLSELNRLCDVRNNKKDALDIETTKSKRENFLKRIARRRARASLSLNVPEARRWGDEVSSLPDGQGILLTGNRKLQLYYGHERVVLDCTTLIKILLDICQERILKNPERYHGEVVAFCRDTVRLVEDVVKRLFESQITP